MDDLLGRYARDPVLRSLVQLVPLGIGSALDTALTTQLANIRRNRSRIFFDELAKGMTPLSPDLIESEDFLHCYFSTLKAALNSRRTEKIRLLAALLRASVIDEQIRDTDEYEELLATLDDLSYRELEVLVLLDKYSNPDEEPSHEAQVQLRREFKSVISDRFGIAPGEIPAVLAHVQRSGLFAVATTGVGYDGAFRISSTAALGFGELSPRYYRLKGLLGSLGDNQPV